MTCLTVTPDSAAEAVAESAGLIVTHHPILFRSVKKLTDATAEGRMLLALARANVAVYSPHTAFDDADGGINDLLARRLGLTKVGPLRREAVAPTRSSSSRRKKTSKEYPKRCSPPAPVTSATIASAVIAFSVRAHSSALTPQIRRSVKRDGANKSRNGGWKRSAPKPT